MQKARAVDFDSTWLTAIRLFRSTVLGWTVMLTTRSVMISTLMKPRFFTANIAAS